LTTTGNNFIAEWKDGAVSTFDVAPEDYGLARAPLEAIQGGDAEFNAAAVNALLDGEKSAYRDTVVLTAGGSLVVAGKASDLGEGISLAGQSIDDGKARMALDRMIEISHEIIVEEEDDPGDEEDAT